MRGRAWHAGPAGAAVSALPSALRRRSLPALPIVLGLGGLVLAAAAWLLLSGGGNGDEPGRAGATGGASTAALSRSTLHTASAPVSGSAGVVICCISPVEGYTRRSRGRARGEMSGRVM